MFYDITLWTIISLILIMLIHHLFNFFRDTLTVPKVKDLVKQPQDSYKHIETLSKPSESNTTSIKEINSIKENLSIESETDNMKNELKNFFNELKQNNQTLSTNNPFSENKLYSEL